MNPEKLAKLQASVRIGGKGTPRRKVKKSSGAPKVVSTQEDKKLSVALRKMGVQPIQQIEEANMFKADGSVIHMENPTVQASLGANTFVFNGASEEKPLTDLFPGILSQMGQESLSALRRIAEQFEASNKGKAVAGAPAEDDIPELVENLEETKI